MNKQEEVVVLVLETGGVTFLVEDHYALLAELSPLLEDVFKHPEDVEYTIKTKTMRRDEVDALPEFEGF